MLLPLLAFSQEEAFYISFNNVSLADALVEIEYTYDVLFSYKDNLISDKQLSILAQKYTLLELLEIVKERTSLQFKILNDSYSIIKQSNEAVVALNMLQTVLVRSYLTQGIEKSGDGTYKISPVKLGILPGLTEPDVLESIQQLPGVLSPNETATNFFVRGGAADQNRLIWDGINIYHKGHLFGMISPLNPNATSEIKFINKGANARYGERLSSVIDISSRTAITSETKAEIGFNGISGDGLLELSLIHI